MEIPELPALPSAEISAAVDNAATALDGTATKIKKLAGLLRMAAIGVGVLAGIIVVGVFAWLIFYLTSALTPSQVASEALEAMHSRDVAGIERCLSRDAVSPLEEMSQLFYDGVGLEVTPETIAALDDEHRANFERFFDALADFDYTVVDEEVNGDMAIVQIRVRTHDFAKLSKETLSEYFAESLVASYETPGQGPAGDLTAFSEVLNRKLFALGDKTRESQAQLVFVKEAGSWKLAYLDQPACDAVTGGLYGDLLQLSDVWQRS